MGEKKGFNVAGVTFENNAGWKRGNTVLRRIEIIKDYVGHGSKFRAVRELKNEYDINAIRIDVVFKSGRAVDIGYVPQGKNRLADELAPLIDNGNHMHITFGRKHVNEKTGETWGLALRYQIITTE